MSKSYDLGAVDRLFPTFQDDFEKNMEVVMESGAVSDEQMKAEPYLVYRAVLRLTAENYVYTKEGIKVLKNLRHFI